jgi:hypothetical protein
LRIDMQCSRSVGINWVLEGDLDAAVLGSACLVGVGGERLGVAVVGASAPSRLSAAQTSAARARLSAPAWGACGRTLAA